MVGASNDVRHPHIDVVGHHAQVISRAAIAAQQDKIFQFGVSKLDASEHGVVESGGARFWHQEPDRSGFSTGDSARSFFRRNPAAGPFVLRRTPLACRSGAALLQIVFAAKAIVSVPRGNEFCCRRSVKVKALSLKKWSLVPIHPQPAQALQDAFYHFCGRAFKVSVLNAEDQSSAMVAGKQPVKQRGAGPSDMQIAGRRRSKANSRTDSNSLRCHLVNLCLMLRLRGKQGQARLLPK